MRIYNVCKHNKKKPLLHTSRHASLPKPLGFIYVFKMENHGTDAAVDEIDESGLGTMKNNRFGQEIRTDSNKEWYWIIKLHNIINYWLGKPTNVPLSDIDNDVFAEMANNRSQEQICTYIDNYEDDFNQDRDDSAENSNATIQSSNTSKNIVSQFMQITSSDYIPSDLLAGEPISITQTEPPIQHDKSDKKNDDRNGFSVYVDNQKNDHDTAFEVVDLDDPHDSRKRKVTFGTNSISIV